MENKMATFVVMVVPIGSLFGESEAKNFEKCMETCLLQCIIPPWSAACPAVCTIKCTIWVAGQTTATDSQRFCTSGCASTLCSKFITKDNYHLDKVEGCAKGCSQSCRKSY